MANVKLSWTSGDKLAESCAKDPASALLFALDKFLKANKQLLTVAKAVNRKEPFTAQFEQAYNSLMETTNVMVKDKKAADDEKKAAEEQHAQAHPDFVKKIVARSAPMASASSQLCRLCGQLATETQQVQLYKSLGLAATTLRDSLLLMVDTLMQVVPDWQDSLTESHYYSAVKIVEKSLGVLLTVKAKALGDNVVPRGEVAEVTASCCACVSALTKVLYLFEEQGGAHARPLELLLRLKVAGCALSQLGAAMQVAIAKSDLGISHGIMKDSVTAAMDDVRACFIRDTLSICREVMQAENMRDAEQALAVENAIAGPRESVATLLSFVINLSEVNISEVKNVSCKPMTTDIEAAQKLLQSALPERPVQRNPDEKPKDDLDGGDIWSEGPDTEDNVIMGAVPPNTEVRLKAASFNKIVEKMSSSETPERDLLRHVFVMMHPSFTTGRAFLNKLLQRFEVPPSFTLERSTIQRFVCQCIQEWMEAAFEDFNDEVVTLLHDWISQLRSDSSMRGWSKNFLGILQNKRISLEQAELAGAQVDLNLVDERLLEVATAVNPSKLLEKFSEEDIAKQLTLTDFAIYAKIRPIELIDQAWNKPKYKYRSINVSRLIRRATDTSLWVCSLLLWPKTLRERVRVLTKVIEIAQVLKRLNNFHGLVSFMSALNLSAIHRLKHTFEALPEDTGRSLEELRELTSVQKHHKNYRAALAAVVDAPAIPFLGISLTDVTMLDDGNASFTRDLVNVYKFDRLYSVISEVLAFQEHPYVDIQLNEQLSLLLTELPHNNEEDLFKLSLLREPRSGVVV